MKNEKTNRRGLIFGLGALFGCVTHEEHELPVQGQGNDEWFFHNLRAYPCITRENAERQIVQDASRITTPESWLYFEEKHLLAEAMIGEHTVITPEEKGNKHFYSVGVLKEKLSRIAFIEKLRREKTNLLEKLNGENAIMAVPSAEWADKLYTLQEICKATKIADHQGIMTVTFEEELEKKLSQTDYEGKQIRNYWRAELNKLYGRYTSLLMGYDEYREELERIGVNLSYQKLKDRPITKKDLRNT